MPPASTYYPHKIELCCINVQFERVFLRGATQKEKAERIGLLSHKTGLDQATSGFNHDFHRMLDGLQALMQDEATDVIVLISKPPSPTVATRILEQAQFAGKPVVVNFIGSDPQEIARPNVSAAMTLASAAEIAVALANHQPLPEKPADPTPRDIVTLQQSCLNLSAARQDIRGVFAGGTFCYEAQLICQQNGFSATSNTPVSGNKKLQDIWQSHGHTLIDMG